MRQVEVEVLNILDNAMPSLPVQESTATAPGKPRPHALSAPAPLPAPAPAPRHVPPQAPPMAATPPSVVHLDRVREAVKVTPAPQPVPAATQANRPVATPSLPHAAAHTGSGTAPASVTATGSGVATGSRTAVNSGTAARSGSAVEAGSGNLPVTAPRYNASYLNNPPPPYPPAARRRKLEGTVTVRVAVGADGHPTNVTVQKGSGAGILDEAAVEAVRHWSFVPARRGDKSVAATVEVPVRFRLN